MPAHRSKLKLLERHHVWNGAAWRGIHGDGVDGVAVLVQLGSQRISKEGVEVAREEAAFILEETAPGVLRLLDVMEHDRRVAWVYEDFDGVGLSSFAGDASETVVPARVACELVAEVVDVLVGLPGPVRHPGPEDSDVLVDDAGVVRLAGFVGPGARSPRLFAPFGDQGDAALVFRLGVYLGTMLAGAPPGQATDETGHAATVRRMLVRAMARPGVGMPEATASTLRAMLAWDPDDRPRLQTLPCLLREGTDADQPALGDWCARHLPAVRLAAVRQARLLRGEPVEPEPFGDNDDLTAVEEPTAVVRTDPSMSPSHLNENTQQTHRRLLDVRGGTSLVPARFPVVVGPPPELAKKRPMLPRGFLGDDNLPESTFTGGGPLPPTVPRTFPWPLILGALFALMLLLALVALGAFLASRPIDTPAASPSIGDALGSQTDADDRYDVTIKVRGGEPFTVECSGDVSASGVDEVVLRDALAGPCHLSGRYEGESVLVPFRISGDTTVRCFQTRQPICR